MMKRLAAACLAMVLSGPIVFAADEGEVLQMPLPEGYEQGYSDNSETQNLVEFVPLGQTVENWQELLTVQVFYGMTNIAARDFAEGVIGASAEHCPGATGAVIQNEPENGYDVALFMVSCPGMADSERPEWTLFKGILGKDSFYLVHKAWAYRPEKDAVVQWSQYLYGVGLCDIRIKGADCTVQ